MSFGTETGLHSNLTASLLFSTYSSVNRSGSASLRFLKVLCAARYPNSTQAVWLSNEYPAITLFGHWPLKVLHIYKIKTNLVIKVLYYPITFFYIFSLQIPFKCLYCKSKLIMRLSC